MTYRFVCSVILTLVYLPLVSAESREDALNKDLFQSIRKNDLASVKALLRKGAAANAKDTDGATPLMHAAIHASPECVKLLLDKGANPNVKNSTGATALMWGIGDIRKVRLLLQKGADVNARSNSGKTPLLLAAGYSGASETVQLLLGKGADLKAKDDGEANAVVLAAESGDVGVLRLLLDKGGDPNSRAGQRFNEIHFGTLAEVKERLEKRQEAFLGLTALMVAADQGNREAIKLLLERGADAKAVTGGASTALHSAVKRGDPETIRALLDKGAPVNQKDFEGNTPLIVAAAADGVSADVIRILVGKGAELNVKGAEGRTALAWAKTKGETETVKALKEAGASE